MASFQGIVQTQYQGAKGGEGLYEQDQQQVTGLAAGPGGPIQDPVIVLDMAGLAQAHDPQGGGDGAFPWGQDGTYQQPLGMLPDSPGEKGCEYHHQPGKLNGQGEHR